MLKKKYVKKYILDCSVFWGNILIQISFLLHLTLTGSHGPRFSLSPLENVTEL